MKITIKSYTPALKYPNPVKTMCFWPKDSEQIKLCKYDKNTFALFRVKIIFQ